ncbi:MAG TPA: hypothetical protein VJ787_13660 [Thermoleophilia bacterium]|nr:hypothetical protein [Thermoleophilia bacterium]
MKRKSVCAVLLCLAFLVILALAAAPAGAIVGGTQDSDNLYFDVGLVVRMGAFVPGQWGFSASCTLVRNDPGNVVVLWGAHQLYGWAATDNCVTFNAVPDFGWVWTDSTGIGIGNVKTYPVIAQVLHPSFVPRSSPSKLSAIGPGQEDVALMWLSEQVKVRVPGSRKEALVKPAPIVGLHGLNALDLKAETFTAVGYGLTGWLQGSDVSLFAGGKAVVTWNGRNYKEVSVVTEDGAYSDRYLQLTAGQADSDSGGPLLHDGSIVAVCSYSSHRQESPIYDYRLDTQSAQDFVNYWLANGPPK